MELKRATGEEKRRKIKKESIYKFIDLKKGMRYEKENGVEKEISRKMTSKKRKTVMEEGQKRENEKIKENYKRRMWSEKHKMKKKEEKTRVGEKVRKSWQRQEKKENAHEKEKKRVK